MQTDTRARYAPLKISKGSIFRSFRTATWLEMATISTTMASPSLQKVNMTVYLGRWARAMEIVGVARPMPRP